MTFSTLKILQFPCREDNYGIVLIDKEHDIAISIDAPELEAIEDVLNAQQMRLTHILTTHHHGDHVAANLPLKHDHNCIIMGPADEAKKIPGIDQKLNHDDVIHIGPHRVKIIATPGHTLGQIAYYFIDQGVVFCADALFALGCGRIFEGTPEMMFTALMRLAQLPDDTVIYAGHEYTLANARFALTIDPENRALIERAKEIEFLRDEGKPTLPTTLGLEKQTNPFLRANNSAIRAHLGLEHASDLEVFTEIRTRKDRF